jgi:hypothetical protein
MALSADEDKEEAITELKKDVGELKQRVHGLHASIVADVLGSLQPKLEGLSGEIEALAKSKANSAGGAREDGGPMSPKKGAALKH